MKYVKLWRLGVLGSVVLSAAAAAAQPMGPSPQEMFTRLDSNGDGKIALDELPAAQRSLLEGLVKAGDRDKDGALNKEEFSVVLEYRDLIFPEGPGGQAGDGPFGRSPLDPRRMWQRIDGNQDGKITLEEAPEQLRPLIRGLLQRAGKGPDESLSAEEFAKLLPPGPAAGLQRDGFRPPLMLFRKLDSDADGKISKDELAKAVEKFDELDTNKDGGLDPGEWLGQLAAGFGPADRFAVPQRDGAENSRRGPGRRPDRPQGPGERPGGGEFIERLFEQLDRDGDGKLSRDEAPARLKENFSKVDADGDGAVSVEEWKHAIPARPGRP